MRSKYLAPAFWAALALTIALIVARAANWISLSWWAVPYPVLVYLSALAIRLIGTMVATEHIIQDRLSNKEDT